VSFTTRSTRNALVAYLLLAGLILGGVTWGTISTLELERARSHSTATAAFRDTIDRGLSLVDSILWPVVLEESKRQYWEYTPRSERIVHTAKTPDGTELPAVVVPRYSPILEANLQPWIQLHFQVSPTNEWQSPQAPAEPLRDWSGSDPPFVEEFRAKRYETLSALQNTCISYDLLGDRIAAAQKLADEFQRWAFGGDLQFGPERIQVAQPTQRSREYARHHESRASTWHRSQQLPPEACDTLAATMKNLGNRAIDPDDEFYIPVSTSSMTAIWLDCHTHTQHELAFVRSLNVGGTIYYQGFLVDWNMLKSVLLEALHPLLPGADLQPVTEPSVGDWLMRTMPVKIVAEPPPIAATAWTSTHFMLIVAWAAAITILAAVGVGIHTLLSLAERRTQFAYAVTHELRTPLTTLRLYTDMLAAGLVKKDQHDRYFQTLNTEAERLSGLVNDVLEYARVENRSVKLDLKEITVAQLLESVREHCADRCDGAGKKLVVEANGLATKAIRTDANLVRQVLANLIENACRYSRDATDPTILIRAAAQHGDRISIDIQDRGPGINPADRQTIFKPFRRGTDGAEKKPGGIGLGLALARSWAHLLGGRLELITDQTDPGTCFRLTIPATHP
jgi:signal transduction histidine kinase